MSDPKPFVGLVKLAEAHSYPTEGHDHRSGHVECPVCSLHDRDAQDRHLESCERCRLLGQALIR